MRMKNIKIPVCLLLLTVAASAVHGQWIEQDVNLKKGWNAVHLKVNPAETACSSVFSNSAVKTVSWYNREQRDDGSGIAPTVTMLNWYRTNASASTFGRVIGGYSYLVEATANATITVRGTPARPRTKLWLGESNLVGLWLPPNADAFYTDYYDGMLDKLAGNPVYTVNATTGDEQRWNLSAKIPAANPAIWLATQGAGTADWMGPLEVTLSTVSEILDWDEDTEVRRVTVKNVSTIARPVRLDLESSLTPPSGQGTLAGQISLLKEEIDWTAGYPRRVYEPCAFPIVTNLAAGASVEFGFRPNLEAMPPAEGAYQGVLVIDDAGVVVNGVAVSTGIVQHRVGLKANGSLAETRASAGLWYGNVTLMGVNRAKPMTSLSDENTWNSKAIQPATQPFSFRLIVHVDAHGTAKVLKEVFVASETADDAEPVLLVSRKDAVNYRNGHPNAKIRRLSSANFPFFGDPQEMEGGDFAKAGEQLVCDFAQLWNDKVNPFVHDFHPSHDNKTFRNKIMYDKGNGDEGIGDFESWSVRRKMILTFAAEDPLGANVDWNGTVTGGHYREEVSTLHETPIYAEGSFRLTRLVTTPNLTHVID